MGVRRLAVANGPNIFQMLLVLLLGSRVGETSMQQFHATPLAANIHQLSTVMRERALNYLYIIVQWARGKGSSPGRVEGSSRAMLATAKPSCFIVYFS